ncbi:MAG: cytochrome c3 family protein [Gemmatimonadota bacterium]
MRTKVRRAIPSVLVLAGAVVLVSCVDESVVFEDRPIYQRVADTALGYLGYADPSAGDQLTFCGQCHGALQADWEQTGHAGAWEGLQQSDHAQAFCEACHTVNSLGNVHPSQTDPGAAIGGHVAVDDGRYHDVQCESCHGPGLDHTLDPVKQNVPLAPISAGTELAYGCGECHSGTHHPFVSEWAASPHGSVNPYPATLSAECGSCHTGEGALQRLGVDADYLEKDELLASSQTYAQITCAVCHDPHSAEHEGQLRVPVDVAEVEDHLCAQCHDRGTTPDSTGGQRIMAHSPESGLLAGSAGWFPPGSGLSPGSIEGPHGPAGNSTLCASCHVVPYSVDDEDSGTTFTSVGHGFRAAPCVDENGLPSGETGCELSTDARSFEGCAECHGSADEALAALEGVLDEIVPLAETLRSQLNSVDSNGAAPGGEIDPSNPVLTVAEGAYFNLQMAHHRARFRSPQGPEAVRRAFAPGAVHNPELIVALLEASIQAMQSEYGVAADPAPESATPR